MLEVRFEFTDKDAALRFRRECADLGWTGEVHGAAGVKVTVDVSDEDGLPVVFVDTDENHVPHDPAFKGPAIRIRLNDDLVYGRYGPTDHDERKEA